VFYTFDIETGTWGSIPLDINSPCPRNFHSCCVYKNEMYLFGGKSNGYHSDLYKFNFKQMKWQTINATGKLPLARYGHSLSFYKGKLYVFGGYDQHGMDDDVLYEFNPDTISWLKIKVQFPTEDEGIGRFHHCQAVYKDFLFVY